jgi:hypothetical protein
MSQILRISVGASRKSSTTRWLWMISTDADTLSKSLKKKQQHVEISSEILRFTQLTTNVLEKNALGGSSTSTL